MSRFLDFDVRFPLIQAPMAGTSTPDLAAAVCQAGGIGSLGLGASSVEQATSMIDAMQARTNRAFNINLFCHQPDSSDPHIVQNWLGRLEPAFRKFGGKTPESLREIYRSFLVDEVMRALILDKAPPIVSFHFGLPDAAYLAALKQRGCKLLASATTPDEARMIEQAGLDAVIAQGAEAGGHRGTFGPPFDDGMIGTMALVPMICDAVNIPVIAAGGLSDGRGIAAAMVLGASAVQLGTAFINCHESSAPEAHKELMGHSGSVQTITTSSISGRPARAIRNHLTALTENAGMDEVPSYPHCYDASKALNAMATSAGSNDYGAFWAGQAALLCSTPSGADQKFRELVSDALSRMPDGLVNKLPGKSVKAN